MELYQFIKRAAPKDLSAMLYLTAASGVANACLMALINAVAGSVASGVQPGIGVYLGYAGAFLVYFFANRTALLRANRIIERLLKELRLEIADKIRRSELLVVDQQGRGELYTFISQETNHLSQIFPVIVNTFQQAVLLVVCTFYIGYVSTGALVLFLTAVSLGTYTYLRLYAGLKQGFIELAGTQSQQVDAFGHIIDGFKELRINYKKSDAVSESFGKISAEAETLLVDVGERWIELLTVSSIVVYAMLGVVAFVFPEYITGHSDTVFKLTAAFLFCVGPLLSLIFIAPMALKANIGLRMILELEQKLVEGGSVDPAAAIALAAQYAVFEQLRFKGITFSHRDKDGESTFSAGPWDMVLNRGELVFLIGGNGSGKSTVLRLLTGLYRAEAGTLSVDDRVVRGNGLAGYRELFSAVFADFHLFDKLYGAEDVPPEKVNQLIYEMGLAGKVEYVDGRFTALNLSTGQRKRLALIAALLDDRPVYVFDEWTADQDAHFREHFYTHILQEMKAQGKTVVAVTHDDRFWHRADRVIKFELGQIVWEKSGAELGNGD